MKRKGSAIWNGPGKDGSGTVATETGVLNNAKYTFGTRFGEDNGTNPEELIGAAHAGCFSMAFSLNLANEGLKPEKIETTATVTIEKSDLGFTITGIHLDVTGKVPGTDQATFQKIADKAKAGCPVSRALSSTPITMTATLQ